MYMFGLVSVVPGGDFSITGQPHLPARPIVTLCARENAFNERSQGVIQHPGDLLFWQ